MYNNTQSVNTSKKMVKIALKSLSEQEFIDILNNQFNALLKGGSLDDIDVFRVFKHSLRGSGFLDILSSIGKFVLPAVKKYIVPVASEFAHGVIDDLSQGKNFKYTMKTRGKKGLKKIGSKILHGKGIHRRRKQSKRLRKPPKNYKKKRCVGGTKRKTHRKKSAVKKGNRKRRNAAKRTKYHDIFS